MFHVRCEVGSFKYNNKTTVKIAVSQFVQVEYGTVTTLSRSRADPAKENKT